MSVANQNFKKIYTIISAPSVDRDQEPSLPKSSLEQRIKDRYTLSFWNENLLDRHNWKGRATHKLHQWTKGNTENSDKRWRAIFHSALLQGKVDTRTFSPRKRQEFLNFKNKYHPVVKTEIDRELNVILQSASSTYPASEALPWMYDSDEIKKMSLLKDLPSLAIEKVTPTLLSTLCSQSSTGQASVEDLIPYVMSQLQEGDLKGVHEIRESLVQAQALDKDLQNIINYGCTNPIGAKKQLAEFSESVAKNIHGMAVGKRNLIFGGCPERLPKIKHRLSIPLASKLKGIFEGEAALKDISKNTVNSIVAVLNQELSQLIPQDAKTKIQKIFSGEIVKVIFPRLCKSLFEDRSFAMKALLAPAELLRYGTEQELSVYAREMSEDFSQGIVSSISPEMIARLHKMISEGQIDTIFLQAWVDKILGATRSLIVNGVSSALSELPPYIPTVISALGLGDVGSPAQSLWFEISREAEGKFTLALYAVGSAVLLHPSHQVPLFYRNLSSEQLDPLFFHRLFSYLADPKWNSSKSYTIDDIHRGLLASLNRTPEGPKKSKEIAEGSNRSFQDYFGSWGMLQVFINEHLGFPLNSGKELFYFNLKKQALLDAWAFNQKNAASYSVLSMAAEHLSREALRLFQAKILTLDQFKIIYATTSDLREKIEKVEKDKRSVTQNSMVIPVEVLPALQNIFHSINGVASRATLSNLIAGALGEEACAAIDQMQQDIVPVGKKIPDIALNQKSLPWRVVIWVAKEINQQLGHLGLGVEDIQRLYKKPTLFRVAILIAKITLFILAPMAFLEGAITVIALHAIAELVAYCFPNAMKFINGMTSQLFQIRNKFFVKMMAYCLLTDQERDQFNGCINQWRAILTRRGTLSYDISLPKSTLKPLQLKVTSPTTEAMQTQVMLIAEAAVPVITLPLTNCQPKRILITETNVIEALTKWVNTVEKHEQTPRNVFSFLSVQLKDLPVPLPGGLSDCWSRVSDYQTCLDQIATLALIFHNAASRCSREQHSQMIVLQFKLYAIVDKLARRCPKSRLNNNYASNPWALAFWQKGSSVRLIDPQIKLQLTQLLLYHGIDPHKEYTEQEVEQLASTALFYKTESFVNRTSPYPGIVGNISLELGQSVEMNYCQELSLTTDINQQLVLLGFGPNASAIDKTVALFCNVSISENKEEKEVQEIKEAQGKYGDDVPIKMNPRPKRQGILPLAFQRLRLMNLLAHCSLKYWKPLFTFSSIDGLCYEIVSSDHFIRDPLDQTIKFIFGTNRVSKEPSKDRFRNLWKAHSIVSGPIIGDVHDPIYLRPIKNALPGWAKQHSVTNSLKREEFGQETLSNAISNYLHYKPRDQSAIINEPSTFFYLRQNQGKEQRDFWSSELSGLPTKARRALEMIWIDQSTQVVNSLSFLRQQLSLLKKTEFLTLLDVLLFHDDLLIKQLQTKADFGLGEFFVEALNYFMMEEDFPTVLTLIGLGIFAQTQAESITKIPLGFPNFKKHLLDIYEHCSNLLFKNRCGELFILPYYFINPEDVSKEHLEQAVEDICLSTTLLDLDNNGLDFEEMRKMYREAFNRWEFTILRFLTRSENTKAKERILTHIAFLKGFIPSQKAEILWSGVFPEYQSSWGIISFNINKLSLHTESSNKLRNIVQNKLIDIFGGEAIPRDVQPMVRGRILIPSEKISFEFRDVEAKEASEGMQLIICKEFEGKKFNLVNFDHALPNVVGNKLSYWLEMSNTAERLLLILDSGKLRETRILNQKLGELATPETFIFHSHTIIEGKKYQEINLEQIPGKLDLLVWFQPLSSIKVFCAADTPSVIKRIEFTKLGIHLNIQNISGAHQAVNDELVPGFFVSREQRKDDLIPALRNFSNYLLWEDGKDQYKLMLTQEALWTKIGALFLKKAGFSGLPSLLESRLDQVISQMLTEINLLDKKSRLYVYDFNEKGHPASNNLEALLYLVMFHLSEGRLSSAKNYLSKIERLAKQQEASPHFLLLCSITEIYAMINQDPKVILLALRITALREENNLTQHEAPVTKKKFEWQSIFPWIVAQTNFLRYLRREGKEIDTSINEFQELFILKGIANQAKEILSQCKEDLFNYSSKEASFLNLIELDTLSECFLMHPLLSKRYGFLTRKHKMSKESSRNWKEYVLNYLLNNDESLIPGLSTGRGNSLLLKLFEATINQNYKFCYQIDKIDFTANWNTPIPLLFHEINLSDITSYLPIYYFLAKNEIPQEMQDPEKVQAFKERAAIFRRTLSLLHSPEFNDVITPLRLASEHPKLFPSAQKFKILLDHAHQARQSLTQQREAHAKLRNSFSTQELLIEEEKLKIKSWDCIDKSNEAFDSWKSACRLAFTLSIADEHLIKAAKESIVSTATSLGEAAISKMLSPIIPVGRILINGVKTILSVEAEEKKLKEARVEGEAKSAVEDAIPIEWQETLHQDDLKWHYLLYQLHFKYFNGPYFEDENRESRIDPFSSPQDDPLLNERFKRLNASLTDYYQRPHVEKIIVRAKGLEELHQLNHHLEQWSNAICESLEQEKLMIVKWATQSRTSHHTESEILADLIKNPKKRGTLSQKSATRLFETLLKAFADSDEKLLKSTTLTSDQLPQLQLLLHRYAIKLRRLEQVLRSNKLLTKALESHLELSDPKMELMVEQASIELIRERAYQFDISSARLLRTYQVLENFEKIMLWKKQVPQIQRMLLGKNDKVVLELQPGGGKTTLTPLVTSFSLNGKQTLHNFFPEALAVVNIPVISSMSYKIFGQISSAISITRRKPLAGRHLWALSAVYRRAIQSKEFFNGRKNDLLSLQMRFIEALYNKESDAILEGYKQLLVIIRTQVRGNIDEAHREFLRNKELKHPLGVKSQIKQSILEVIQECARLISLPEIEAIIDLRNPFQKKLEPKIYIAEVMPKLARWFSDYHLFRFTPEHKKEFVEYVSSGEAPVPDFIKTHQLRSEIGMVVGLLREILFHTLTETVINLNYGPSMEGRGEFARPNSANKTPDETATFHNPFEAALKTFLLFLHERLNSEQALILASKIYERAEKEKKKLKIRSLEETPTGKIFSGWCKGRYQINEFSPEKISDVRSNPKILGDFHDSLNRSNAAVLTYVRLCVMPQIKYYTESISHNAHHFAAMFPKRDSYYSATGSPNRDATFPTGTVVLWDKGTTGEFINRICKTCSEPDSFIELVSEEPKKAIQELLTRQFTPDSKMCAIVDTGALFRGLKNEEVAKQIMNFIVAQRPDIKGVVFFNDKKHLVVMQKGNSKPIPLEKCALLPEERITFYDHGHFYGADIIQRPDGGAAVTLAEDQDIENLMQGNLRMRKYLVGNQFIRHVFNRTVGQLMFGKEAAAIRGLITTANANEGIVQGPENYLASRIQIEVSNHRAVLDAMIFADDVASTKRIYAAFSHLFVNNEKLDPFNLYAYPKMQRSPEAVLEDLKRVSFTPIQESSLLSQSTKEDLWTELQSIGKKVYPKFVSVTCSGDSSIDSNLNAPFGAGSEIVETEQQQQEQERNLQLEQNLTLETQDDISMTLKDKLTSKLAAWDAEIPYFAKIDWVRFEPSVTKRSSTNVVFYQVPAVLNGAKDRELAVVASAFGTTMAWSNNSLGILDGFYERYISVRYAEPCSKLQKPIRQLLLISNIQSRGSQLICSIAVDQNEVIFWQNQFEKDRRGLLQNPKIKIALYDIGLNQIVNCGKNRLEMSELFANKNFCYDLLRWKFLAGHTNTKFRLPGSELVDEELPIWHKTWMDTWGFEKMKHEFRKNYKNAGLQSYEGSDLEYLFEVRSDLLEDPKS